MSKTIRRSGGLLDEHYGKSHEQGGIKKAYGEIEGGETTDDNFVFSNSLPSRGLSFADITKHISKRYNLDNKPTDYLARMSMQTELNHVKKLNAKAASQEEQMFKRGGKKYANGSYKSYKTDPVSVDPARYDYPFEIPNLDPTRSNLPLQRMEGTNFTTLAQLKNEAQLPNSTNTTNLQLNSWADTSGQATFGKDYNSYKQSPTLPPMPTYTPPENKGIFGNIDAQKAGLAASMFPMVASSLSDLIRSPEQAKSFRNDQMYEAIDLAQQNRINDSALINEANRTANSANFVTRSAQVNNALRTNVNAGLMQQEQNIALNTQNANNQYRSQEAQLRSQLGSEDRGYRHQQYVEQSQNDANTRTLGRQAAQNLFNVVGTNINQNMVAEKADANMRVLMGLNTQQQLAILNSYSDKFGVSKEYAKSLMDYAISGGDKDAAQKLSQVMEEHGIFSSKFGTESQSTTSTSTSNEKARLLPSDVKIKSSGTSYYQKRKNKLFR